MKVTDVKCFTVDCFRTNWVFVKVYTDEGITGTSTKHREGFKQIIRLVHHQMRIENHIAMGTQHLYKSRAKADIRHKMAVHNIQMKIPAPGIFHCLYLPGSLPDIRRQKGRSYHFHL